ncbi:right-handed parallel beta-helix repeat-containing protein [Pseudooceanicola sp. LIPI14-2-Ac024]|uniref:right-handed parallel beta-helix repeat-containing protein n=1 Tax=Pseudooceanicola sp. LIPI14-2-Ac024 TaxID=3344875 RepID=UPI0035CF057F
MSDSFDPDRPDVYVSPHGDDGWSGRRPDPLPDRSDGPKASFEAARDATRDRLGPNRIIVRGGRYTLRAPVVFDARDAGLSIVAAEGERPVIFGGAVVEGWVPEGDGRWSAPVDPGAGSRVRALFRDGVPQTEARHPDRPVDGDPRKGWLFVAPPDDSQSWTGNTRFETRPGDLPPLDDLAGVTAHVVGGFFPGTQWGSDTLPVTAIDAATGVVRTEGTNYFFTGVGSRYFLAGAEAFLDAPGEWWFDAAAGRIHYIPEPGSSPEGARMIAAHLPTFFRFSGASDIVVRGLELREGAPEGTGKVGTDTRGYGAIRLEGVQRALIAGNRLEHVGVGIHVAESADVVISDNDISHVAGNGIYFGTRYGTFGRSDRGAILCNRIHDVGRVYFEGAGITFQAVEHLRVMHNEIAGAAQFAIAGGSIWEAQDASRHIVIEHNVIRDANRLTSDGGAIKLMGTQSTPLHASVSYNVITGTDQLMARPDGTFWPARYENVDEWPSPISWAIYLDGRASGVSVIGNRLDRNVAGIGINGGWSNVVRDNVILGGAGDAFRIDDATGRDWRPDWAEPNRIEDNFVRVDRPDGRAVDIHTPGHGDTFVRFSGNAFEGNVTELTRQNLTP